MIRKHQHNINHIVAMVGVLMPRFPYHNIGHALDVYNTSVGLAAEEGLGAYETWLVGAAGLLHDVIYLPHAIDNEEKASAFTESYLTFLGCPKQDIEIVSRLVLATKLPTQPNDILESIVCDADLDNLGRKDYLEKNKAVREELGIPENIQWYQGSICFLDAHHYYTASARKLREQGKQENKRLLQEIIGGENACTRSP